MTSLRQRMLEDMRVRRLSPFTQRTYVETVARFARYFDRSPERLGPEQIRAYQVYLATERRLATSSLLVAVSALRFLYRVTLQKRWSFDDVAQRRARSSTATRAVRWPLPTRRRSARRGGPGPAADTASSGRPRCRSEAPAGAPGEGLPDTVPPRRSLRPRRRSPDRWSAPAPPRSRRRAPGTAGVPAGHSARRDAGRDDRRDPAAASWRKVRLAGVPRGARSPTAVSGARSRVPAARPDAASRCSGAAGGHSHGARPCGAPDRHAVSRPPGPVAR